MRFQHPAATTEHVAIPAAQHAANQLAAAPGAACRATIWTTWSATNSATTNGCILLDWGDGRQARSRLGGGLKGQALRPLPQSRHLKTVST